MSVITPDGQSVSMPRSDKRRGRTISDAEARRYRDRLIMVLVRLVGLTPVDAEAVFGGSISRSQIDRRLAEVPGDPEQIMRDMLIEARYGTQERLGSRRVGR